MEVNMTVTLMRQSCMGDRSRVWCSRGDTSVGEEAVIMVRLKEAQQDCQDRHGHQGGQSNVVQVRQSFP